MFEELKTYVMFIGYPRSGSTLMGALLDAHPNAIVSREAHVLNLLAHGYRRDRIYNKIIKNSKKMADGQVKWNGYKYVVKDQYQGTYKDKLLVIGDKKAGKSVKLLWPHPELIDMLKEELKIPVKLIHVIRNPFDNITTIKTGNGGKIDYLINDYFKLAETIVGLRKKYKEDIFEYHHEDFIDTPKLYLTKLCQFLGLKVYPGYLPSCKSIVFKSPHKTRNKIKWNDKNKKKVQKKINKIGFLKGYKF